jgi:hypothetical protein
MSNHNVNAAQLRKAMDVCQNNGWRNELVDELIDKHPGIFLKLMNVSSKVKVLFTSWVDGDKIPAIKLFRDVTGSGLAESKYIIEDIQKGKPAIFIYTPHNASVMANIEGIPVGTSLFTVEEAERLVNAIKRQHPSYNTNMKFEIVPAS